VIHPSQVTHHFAISSLGQRQAMPTTV
jgi:hypothetical protein